MANNANDNQKFGEKVQTAFYKLFRMDFTYLYTPQQESMVANQTSIFAIDSD